MGFLQRLYKESGSVVTVMMGGIALLAAISFTSYQFISGPLSITAKVTQNNAVKAQQDMIGRRIIIDATADTVVGDCDLDGYIEPQTWYDASGDPAPTNAGWIPNRQVETKDPWGMEYGYCVWDLGTNIPPSGEPKYYFVSTTTENNTCALKDNNTLWCWGTENFGQFGDGGAETDSTSVPAQSDPSSWEMIGRGYSRTYCGIKTDASAWCWGGGTQGELGNGASVNSASPVEVSGSYTWVQVAAGNQFACGIQTDGSGWCWGRGRQRGDGVSDPAAVNTPQSLDDGGATWKKISAGSAHACGIKDDDEIYCWGTNAVGRNGNGTNTGYQYSPGVISESGPWIDVSAGGQTTCAVKTDGSLWCWGKGQSGSLADGVGGDHEEWDPIPADDPDTWLSVEVGASNGCGVKSDGTGWCWGLNANGIVGDGTSNNRTSPVEIDGSYNWKYVTIGQSHACGVQDDSSVWCWGRETGGQLGNGSDSTTVQYSPVQLASFSAPGVGCSDPYLDGPDISHCSDDFTACMTPDTILEPYTGLDDTPHADQPATFKMKVKLPNPLVESFIVETGNYGNGMAIWLESDNELKFAVGNGVGHITTTSTVGIGVDMTGRDGDIIEIVAAVDPVNGLAALYIDGAHVAQGATTDGSGLKDDQWSAPTPDMEYGIGGGGRNPLNNGIISLSETNGVLLSDLTIYGNELPPSFPNPPPPVEDIDDTVIAVISAGPDRTFSTTCSDYVDADTDVISSGGDDIVKRYSYGEASVIGASLWNLKAGDTTTAETDKDVMLGDVLEFDTGNGLIQASVFNTSGLTSANGGVMLGNEERVQLCDATDNEATMRYNATENSLEVCTGAGGWVNISGTKSWPLLAPDGSAGAPSYSFTNATDAGLYYDGSSVIFKGAATNTAIVKRKDSFIHVSDTMIEIESDGTLSWYSYGSDNIALDNGGDDFRIVSEGGVQIGDTTATCNATLDGTLKFLTSGSKFQFCNGTDWVDLILPQVTSAFKTIGHDYPNSCGIWIDDGQAYCWGGNAYNGALGDGQSNTQLVPSAISDSATYINIGKGYSNACAVKDDGTAICWGENGYGQNGKGSIGGNDTTPVSVTGSYTWLGINAGEYHACGIQSDDTGWCWGRGANGRLGNAGTANQGSPVEISGSYSWAALSAGDEHTCGIQTDGTAWCWGNGSNGRLGDGSSTQQTSPIEVSGSDTWVAIAAGADSTCGIKDDYSLWCWGNNSNQQLGDGTTTARSTPVAVTGGGEWLDVSVGRSGQACGIKTDNTLWCWGYGVYESGGTPSWYTKTAPYEIQSGTSWKEVAAGGYSVCATKTDNPHWCWGEGQAGKLGNNDTNDTFLPVEVSYDRSALTTMYAFVTVDTKNGWGLGADGFHSHCRGNAIYWGLPGTYKAWISDSGFSPATDFFQSSVPYVLPGSGTKIADNWADLTDGTLDNAFDRDGGGNLVNTAPYNVYTSTDSAGVSLGANNCGDWTQTGNGGVGDYRNTDTTWSNNTTLSCGTGARIYCFQQ